MPITFSKPKFVAFRHSWLCVCNFVEHKLECWGCSRTSALSFKQTFLLNSQAALFAVADTSWVMCIHVTFNRLLCWKSSCCFFLQWSNINTLVDSLHWIFLLHILQMYNYLAWILYILQINTIVDTLQWIFLLHILQLYNYLAWILYILQINTIVDTLHWILLLHILQLYNYLAWILYILLSTTHFYVCSARPVPFICIHVTFNRLLCWISGCCFFYWSCINNLINADKKNINLSPVGMKWWS